MTELEKDILELLEENKPFTSSMIIDRVCEGVAEVLPALSALEKRGKIYLDDHNCWRLTDVQA